MTNNMRKTKSRRRKVILDARLLFFIIISEVDDSIPTADILWVPERDCQVEMAVILYGNMAAGTTANKENKINHDLIMAVINHGYSDELINSVREAGASGGTVLNARGRANEEKDVILILAGRQDRESIMKKISLDFGLGSEAGGLVFSLPVDDVAGRALP